MFWCFTISEPTMKKHLKQSSVCPNEIRDGVPAVVIVDNDDFIKNDTLTGEVKCPQRTNAMYVQKVTPDDEYVDVISILI